jgi:hypothetical protein
MKEWTLPSNRSRQATDLAENLERLAGYDFTAQHQALVTIAKYAAEACDVAVMALDGHVEREAAPALRSSMLVIREQLDGIRGHAVDARETMRACCSEMRRVAALLRGE